MKRTGPGLPEGMEALSRQARALRDALERSEENTQSMVAALGSFDRRVSAIDASVRPAQVTNQSIATAHENIDRTIEHAEAVLAQFDIIRRVSERLLELVMFPLWYRRFVYGLLAEAVTLKGPHENLEGFLEAVDLLKGVVHFFSSNKNFKCCDGILNQVNNLLTKSALNIEEEFRQLMGTYSKPIEPDRLFDCITMPLLAYKGDSESVGEQPSESFETATYRNPALVPSGIIPLLHDIAHQLVQDGNQKSCYRIYRDVRGSTLELRLRKLGIEKLSKIDVERMEWVALKVHVETWTQFMQITVRILLKDRCFAELARSSVMALLSFGDTFAKSKRPHENLFPLLEMYGVMHELQPEIEVIFQGKFCSEMWDAALNLTRSLAQIAHETLVDFEEAVEKDSSKIIMQNGTVHPSTIKVINYVKSLFDHFSNCMLTYICSDLYSYRSKLKILFQQSETGSETKSQLADVIMKIMQSLQNNLNEKSKQYKDPALSHIFLMNNLHYMVMFVRRSQAKDILGDDWIQRHRKIVQQNASQYKRVAWAGVSILQTLTIQTTGGPGSPTPPVVITSGVSRNRIKERSEIVCSIGSFKSFNIQFEELHAKQSQWAIPDQELRDNLRLAVAEVLLPAYRSFVNRFGSLVQRGKNPHKYIKHPPEALDQLLGQFFQGLQVGDHKR
ncbi:hypothetical protein HU200_059702 [Digitaria exilis]|uniref:Exocyst subunit Exo70 family protein n=1 Tax=Digitaria exilis TaxID=1010633 RepID=A0A835AKT2_9POAL|nr:hypothetical protein HU200_059702 [Digitaria exilis]